MRVRIVFFFLYFFAVFCGLSSACSRSRTEPGRIILFDGWSTGKTFYIAGRVVQDRLSESTDEARSRLANAVDAIEMIESDEIPGAVVGIDFMGTTYRATTDLDGRFEVEAEVATSTLAAGLIPVRARLLEDRGHPAIEVEAIVHVITTEPGIAVISDFDDTLVETAVRDVKKMLANTLLKNVAQMDLVDGADRAYEAARVAGARGFFYVSGSPHSFHDRITRFLAMHHLPRGPVMLKNFGEDSILAQDEYKLSRIRRLFTSFPKLNFVLIGDSGERDPEIYRTIAGEFPGRVVAILVRRAPGGDHSEARLQKMIVFDDYKTDTDLVARSLRSFGERVADVLDPDASFACKRKAPSQCDAPFPVRNPDGDRASQAALLTNGEASFAARVQALKAAKISVRIQALIFTGDESGLYVAELLKAKKSQGLDVRVIVDAVSNLSWHTQWMYFDLKQHGIEVEGYEALYLHALGEELTPAEPLRANKRYHDKMWIIDGETLDAVAIVGGLNIANEYFRIDTKPINRWRDQDLILRGEMVADVVTAFDRNHAYLKSIKERLPAAVNPDNAWKLTQKTLGQIRRVQVPTWRRPELVERVLAAAEREVKLDYRAITGRFIQSRPRFGEPYIEQAYLDMIRGSERSIQIANAYFLPSKELIAALHAAVRRGVTITIITNSPVTNDIAQIAVLSRALYDPLLAINSESKGGSIAIHEWIGPALGEGTLHAKYAIFDSTDAIIGSYNFDPRSARWNSETAVVLREEQLVGELERVFVEEDLVKARMITASEAKAFRNPEALNKKFEILFALPLREWL